MQRPVPDTDALMHSARLGNYLRETIATAGGRITFGRYVELALYAPGLGYYTAGSTKFGAGGDFVTAPEVSPLFGRTLARAVAPVLTQLGKDATLLEFGAGTGALALQVLEELERQGSLPAEYCIMEVSADLRERQRTLLRERAPALAERVRWLSSLPQRPMRGVVLANEVVDAVAFERFRVRDGQSADISWVESRDPGFAEVWDRPGPDLAAEIATLRDKLREAGAPPLPAGYVSELRPAAGAFVLTLAHLLEAGLILISDYGGTRREVYLPERSEGTFRTHYRQFAGDDPFEFPGLVDLTAWVDFTALAEAAVDGALDVAGYTTQAHFLMAAGLDQVLADAGADDAEASARLASEARTLTLPGEMGERFKFLGLGRGIDRPLPAFSLRDFTVTL